MRKLFALLVILAVATSAFAFAASFSINQSGGEGTDLENISSGDAPVGRCDSNIETDISGKWSNNVGFVVDTVWVNLNDVRCVGTAVTIVLTKDGENIIPGNETPTKTTSDSGQVIFELFNKQIKVENVEGIEVQVDNINRP